MNPHGETLPALVETLGPIVQVLVFVGIRVTRWIAFKWPKRAWAFARAGNRLDHGAVIFEEPSMHWRNLVELGIERMLSRLVEDVGFRSGTAGPSRPTT